MELSYELNFRFQKSGRVYKADSNFIEIPNFILEKFEFWNTHTPECIITDKKMVLALLLAFVSLDSILVSNIGPDVMDIIHGRCFTRCFINI